MRKITGQSSTALLTLAALLAMCSLSTAAEPVGQFSQNADIGPVRHSGSLEYQPATQQYIMSGSGDVVYRGRVALRLESDGG